MKRRNFLFNASTVLAGTSLIGNSKSWAGANERVNLAMIGMGWRGGQLLPVAANTPGVQVMTLCDPDERRMAEWNNKLVEITDKKAALTPDLREIMEDDKIDAVTISSPKSLACIDCDLGLAEKKAFVRRKACLPRHS